MADTEHREQHNHGSGTFVGGDVHGGLWQVFLPPYGKKAASSDPAPTKRQPEQDDEEVDDYEGRMGYLMFSAWFAASAGLAVVYAITGRPWKLLSFRSCGVRFCWSGVGSMVPWE